MEENQNSRIENNVLVLCMSKLPRELELNHYYYKTEDNQTSYYECVSQLEPACKVIIDQLAKNHQKQHLKILVLNTDDTLNELKSIPAYEQEMTAYEFFQHRIDSFCSGAEQEDHTKSYEINKDYFENQREGLWFIINEVIRLYKISGNKDEKWYTDMDDVLFQIREEYCSACELDNSPENSSASITKRIASDGNSKEAISTYFQNSTSHDASKDFCNTIVQLWNLILKEHLEANKLEDCNSLMTYLSKIINSIIVQQNQLDDEEEMELEHLLIQYK